MFEAVQPMASQSSGGRSEALMSAALRSMVGGIAAVGAQYRSSLAQAKVLCGLEARCSRELGISVAMGMAP